MSVILFDNNIVENGDFWTDEVPYNVHVKYNFGNDMFINKKSMHLIEG